MAVITWSNIKDRTYETGLDRGVLYLPDGSAVPWNGLSSVDESIDNEVSPVYFDGMKIAENLVLGNFSASMKALTYPDEFLELEGLVEVNSGFYAGEQRPKQFGLCYRTRVGDATSGEVGYKLHLLYNVTAVPDTTSYSTQSDSPETVQFGWNISAVPEERSGLRPTAHFVIDSRKVDPWLLDDIESILYGNSVLDAQLLLMTDLLDYVKDWFRIRIIDNGDGTWTAISKRDFDIELVGDIFTIHEANAIYLDDFTYVISDTLSPADITPEYVPYAYASNILNFLAQFDLGLYGLKEITWLL